MNASDPEITLLQLRNLALKLGRVANPSTVELLCTTIWGTPGGMRYQHFGTADKIRDLHDPWFLYLEKEDETLGVLCLDRRMIGEVTTFYIRYFSFAEAMRRKVSTERDETTPASRGQGMFKRFSTQFFNNPSQLFTVTGTSNAAFYAFVEAENARSKDMVAQMGLLPCGQFSTLIFSRIFQRKRAQVRRANPSEYAHLRAQVRAAYTDHAFYTDHGLFHKGDFFVLEQDGQIVAGCQAHQVHWRVVEIPGLAGKLMTKVLPFVPLLRRLFNPEKFDFAAIEGLFCLPSHTHCLQTLLEGVLEMQEMHVALLWLSKDASIYQNLKSNVRMGLLQHFKKDVPAMVAMRPYGLTDAQIQSLQDRPVYVSAFDGT